MKTESLSQRFVRNLELIRNARRLDSDTFSSVAGVSRQHLSLWRTGKNTPTMATVERTATNLGVDASTLLAINPADALKEEES